MKTPRVGIIHLLALLGVGLILGSAFLTAQSSVAQSLREGRPLNGVLIGTDLVDYSRHSDTLMVWNYNPQNAKLDVLSIPRDTKISIPGYRFRRINEVFAYHYGVSQNVRKAARAVMEASSTLLSFEASIFNPSYYIHVDYDGFRQLVELLGGVRVHLDEPMHYDDNAGNYHFHKEAGDHHLTGHEALMFVRYRGHSGDRGRILRQLEFLKTIIDRLASPLMVVRWPRIFMTVVSRFHTNFKTWDLLLMGMEARHWSSDRLNPHLLPSRPRGLYLEVDRPRAMMTLQQIQGTPVETPVPVVGENRAVTVRVWNASGRAGLALEVTRLLRKEGFDVLDYGNYELRQTKTRIMDRSGQFEKASVVARQLGIQSIFSEINPKIRADVEVILGEDFALPSPAAP
ncbi:MAG TPA: LCP family protein [Elusimicrobiota bacterium]|nr:LCP family protein [Elusimicrobiota bacterium]